MGINNLQSRSIGIILVFSVLITDQLSKLLIVKYLHSTMPINDFFNLTLVYNKGISFGLFNGFVYSNYVFSFISIAIILYLVKWFIDSNIIHEIISIGLIIGGALGNVVDRFIYLGVVDFIQLHYNQYYWPSFNIADSAICLGVCILLFFSVFYIFNCKKTDNRGNNK
jgi:signal peptidase II